VAKTVLGERWVYGIYLKDTDFSYIQSVRNSSGYLRKILSLKARFAQGFNGGYWLLDKAGHHLSQVIIIGCREL